MDDITMQQLPYIVTLRILKGPESGRTVTFDSSGNYIIGRHEECDIRLQTKAASRRHAAVLLYASGEMEVEDLGSNNGTILNNEKITRAPLRVGDTLSIGECLLVVEKGGGSGPDKAASFDPESTIYRHKPLASGKGKSRSLRLILLFAGLAAALALLFLALSGPEKGKSPKVVAEQPLAEAPHKEMEQTPSAPADAPKPTEPVQIEGRDTAQTGDTAREETASPESAAVEDARARQEDKKPAEEIPPQAKAAEVERLYQEGMFFYKAGNLTRAVEAWQQAFAMDATHDNVRKWLLRAEGELDAEIDKHFRQALMARKYMRFDEAKHEFNLVIQWIRDKEDQRYQDAVKALQELEEAGQ